MRGRRAQVAVPAFLMRTQRTPRSLRARTGRSSEPPLHRPPRGSGAPGAPGALCGGAGLRPELTAALPLARRASPCPEAVRAVGPAAHLLPSQLPPVALQCVAEAGREPAGQSWGREAGPAEGAGEPQDHLREALQPLCPIRPPSRQESPSGSLTLTSMPLTHPEVQHSASSSTERWLLSHPWRRDPPQASPLTSSRQSTDASPRALMALQV